MEKKYAALTFDDGPTPGITDEVLDILKENDVTASFFVIGQQINEDTKYLLKRAYDQGCTIENHSKTHPFMTELTSEQIKDEIAYTTEKIIDAVGEKPEFFRPPYIMYNQTMYDAIDLTFICGYGCEDWVLEVPAQDRIDRVLEMANPGFIVLLHDMKDNVETVKALRTIIPELKKQGYEFVTIRDLFKKSGVTPAKNVTYMGVNETRED